MFDPFAPPSAKRWSAERSTLEALVLARSDSLIEQLFPGRRLKDLTVEERRMYSREWKRRHPEYCERKRRLQRERYAKDPTYRTRINLRTRAWQGAQDPLTARLKRLPASARHRGYEWTLTDEYVTLVLSQPCTYCGAVPVDYGGTIDRIDSKRGYVEGNVTPACLQCNVAKWHWSVDEFRSWIERVHAHGF